MANDLPDSKTLAQVLNPGDLLSSKAGKLLASIRRDMDLKDVLMRARSRNEEVLALRYQTGDVPGGGDEWSNLREYALNLPYRYARWLESQATSKKMVVKVSRDAGPGQVQGGPGDEELGMWRGIALRRVAYEAGFEREIKALIGEVLPRGTSVLQIGYHLVAPTVQDVLEGGKDAQTVGPEALSGDVEARPGQAHAEISEGLAAQASDPLVQMTAGSEGVDALLARKMSHDAAQFAEEEEADSTPSLDSRDRRFRVWMQKRRVGEDVGWSPWVYDIEDADFWWERRTMTVAEVKASPLFRDEFKAVVEGYDGRNISGVFSRAEMPSTHDMGNDARQAQSEDILDDDERVVELFFTWHRRPEMRSGGVRHIVCAEYPDDYCETDDRNPYVDEEGRGLIPSFFPFYDFTPVLPSQTVPERTCGVPPIAVGMPQFEKIAEYNRIRHEHALRHSQRIYQIDPALKDAKALLKALKNGEDGFAFIAPQGMVDTQGRVREAVLPIQFTGNSQDIDRQAIREESDWVKVMGMPPAILQGVGTAETATQERIGVASGERESGSLVEYFEKRMADVLRGIQGLMRGCYDDEDFIGLLGEQGAAVLKAWQTGTVDDGDEITVTFGSRAIAQETVDKKQLMEAITLLRSEIDPVTGLTVWDTAPVVAELFRRLELGEPKINASLVRQLQQAVLGLLAQAQGGGGEMGAGGNGADAQSSGGPNPSEGEGPTEGNISAGARRDTEPPGNMMGGFGTEEVSVARSG